MRIRDEDIRFLGRSGWLWLLAVGATVLVAAFASPGCGGDDDGSHQSGGNGGSAAAETSPGGKSDSTAKGGAATTDRDAPLLAGDREQAGKAATAVDDVYATIRSLDLPRGRSLIAGGGGALCDLMTEEARKEAIDYVRRSSGRQQEWTCESAVGLLVGRAQRVGKLKRTRQARVVGVNVEGDRATASVEFGKGRGITPIPLVKEEGQWKIGSSPVGGE